jgi:hypothetical protein
VFDAVGSGLPDEAKFKFDENALDKFRQNKTAFAINTGQMRKPAASFDAGRVVFAMMSKCP